MKIQRISQYQGQLSFPSLTSTYQSYLSTFNQTNLGLMHQAIPWEDLVKAFDLKDHKKGPQSIFSPQGKIALMFLKHYAACSDSKLIEQLNGNINYQIFCDIHIPAGQRILNFKIVSEIRTELGRKLDISHKQQVLAKYWSSYMKNKDSVTCDATCYESYLRYPTDIKLLWESVEWLHGNLKQLCKKLRKRMPRSKYKKWSYRYLSYSKMRRKTKKKARPLNRALLLLLLKFDTALTELESEMINQSSCTRYQRRRRTVQKIYEQQYQKFHEHTNPKNRIVSIDKPYIRPIVRGKEIKKVEFGAKVHKLQIDGISFIEHLDFEAFNEGIRLQQTIFTSQILTHTKVNIIGADGIYANNVNRKYVSKNQISTDFKRKGRPSIKHKDHHAQLAKMITKERASRLEGSFGTDKEHFLLNRIKARTKENEILWIFFGIHASNALNVGRRMNKMISKAA